MFSIIIPTLNNYKYLKFCIDSIKKTTKYNNEILVHVSEDNDYSSRNYLDSEKNNTFSSNNVGLCTAINTISREAKNDYLFILDDMYFCPGWEALNKEIINIKHNNFYISGSMIEQKSGHIEFDWEQIYTISMRKNY